MSNTTAMLRALAACAALLQLGAAQAEVTYTSTLHQGYYADPGDIYRTTTGGAYSLSSTNWTMATSGSSANNGTADASFAAAFNANQIWAGTLIEYVFRLTGPADVVVPVHVTANGHVDAYGESFHAAATINVFSPGQPTLVDESAIVYHYGQSQSASTSATLAVDQWVNIRSNTDVYVSLSASAGTYADALGSPVGGHAFIDPLFIVDPAFAAQYTLVGLPAAVPEPASVALLVLGGGFLAVARRRRLASGGGAVAAG
jgi:hypothetical protein